MLINYIIQRISVIAILLFGVVWLSSCQKSADLFIPDPGQPNGADTNWVSSVTGIMPIAILRDSLLLRPQTDSLNSNLQDSIVTVAGVQLTLPPNALQKMDSAPVEGRVKIEFMALQKKGDLIRMNTPTVSDSAVLSTVGTFFIKFTQNANELQVKHSAVIQLTIPGAATGQQSKFYMGQQGPAGIYNWRINTDSFTNYLQNVNNTQIAAVSKLGWISAGYPLPAAFNRIQLALPPQYTNANTAAYVVLNNHRSVISMSDNASVKKFVCDIIPPDQTATVVVISKQGNDYFASTELFTSATGFQVVNLLPVKMSLASLKQMLNTL